MLDPKLLRNQTQMLFKELARRGTDYDMGRYLSLEQQRKELQVQSETTQAELKAQSREIAQLKTAGKPSKSALRKAEKLKSQLGELQTKLNELKVQLNAFLLGLPNRPDSSVPDGIDEKDNLELRSWKQPRVFDFEP